MRRKVLVLAVAFILFTTSFPSVTTSSVKNNVIRCPREIYNDSHIIDNPRVPYVKQTTDVYCGEASITMLINYYGFNATIEEILHNLGYGYSLLHIRFIPGISRIPVGGLGSGSLPSNLDFLASLYNLSFYDYSVRNQPEDILWERYWTKVKKLIKDDIPVLTAVDSCSLTYWKEFFKRHNISENETHNCQHAIVIVGYNDSNGTVCYNDPAVAIFDTEENGTYVFEKKEVFKEAVINAYNGSYCKIWVFKKIPDSLPPSHEERFEKAHKRNIKRLKGDFEAYFGFNLSDLPFFYRLYFSICYRLGIDATKALKKDFQGFNRIITVNQYSKYALLNDLYEMIYIEKHNASQYLLQNVNISPVCKHDGLLLQKESELWKNITLLIKELNKISRNNSLIKTLILAKPLLDEINQLIDKIIEIENAIIGAAIFSQIF
ncbi:MAG: hypothetical protein FE048_03955 [Thermoplasmata archaeon]|nr:MAG: hypothetical protein FE048_03955 [Thermoplasmata archaeon]